MSAKISRARKQAFLKALAETGNQTLSAEKAKVSRSWVCLHRSGDAGFDAACERAIEQAQGALRQAQGERARAMPSPRPSPLQGRGGFFAGEELVVAGTNGVRTQIRRARLHQWTPRVERRFLEALAATCNAKAALAAAGMSKGSAYTHRKRSPGFARAWDEAIAIGHVRLESALIQAIDHAFDPAAPPPEMAVGPVTVSDLIRTLRMYEKRARGR